MKVTKEKAAEHRAAILSAATRLFRERGLDGVGVAEITKSAGLTHGGFYGHFASKDALVAEACGQSFDKSLNRLPGGEAATVPDLTAYLDSYLSERHRDRPGAGCPMAAYASEIPRQGDAVQGRCAHGIARFIDGICGQLPDGADRAQAILILSAMVGGLVLSRATAQGQPDVSSEILETLKQELKAVADATERIDPFFKL